MEGLTGHDALWHGGDVPEPQKGSRTTFARTVRAEGAGVEPAKTWRSDEVKARCAYHMHDPSKKKAAEGVYSTLPPPPAPLGSQRGK